MAVAGDVVVAPAVRGPLRAFESATGAVRWQWAPDRHCWMYFSPAVLGDVVYQAYSVEDGTWVVALDAQTGQPKWHSSQPIGRNWISHASPAVADGRVFFATAYANLVALDAATGKTCWQRSLGAGLGVYAAPVVTDGVVLQTCKGDLVAAVDMNGGDLRWSYTSDGEALLPGRGAGATPAVADGLAYAGFTDGHVTALSLQNGEPIWQHETRGAVLSSPAISGDVLYVGSNDGWLRALDRYTGECLWSADLGAWVSASPAVTGNAVVAAAWDGNVYTFTGS